MPILDGRSPAAIADAARQLAAGELVAFPTETVYGLGARADDDAAVAKVFAAKGRPADHPLIVHVMDEAAAEAFAGELSPLARRLIAAFWPGPLTVIVPRVDGMATAAAGGQGSIGLRSPSHPVARALLQAAAEGGVRGVAAPSANRYGRISPTRALHVVAEFDESLRVLDGGDCEVGIESTIVDCSRGQPVLLRPGVLTRERIESAARAPLLDADADAPRASGTLASHYAPRATLRLMPAAALRTALEVLPLDALPQGGGEGLALYCRSVVVPRQAKRLVHHRMPDDPVAAAHELFAVLRGFDDRGVRLIWVEAPPTDPAWEGVADRLQRAAAHQ